MTIFPFSHWSVMIHYDLLNKFTLLFLVYSSDSEEEANEVFEEAIEQPLTLDETRRLAETWTLRYSKTPEDKQNGDDKGERQEGEDEDEDEDSESYEYEESDEDLSYPEYESEGKLSCECTFAEHADLKDSPLHLVCLSLWCRRITTLCQLLQDEQNLEITKHSKLSFIVHSIVS